MVEHLLDMLLSNNFETSQNQPKFEIGSLYLEFIDNCTDNFKLLDEGDILLVVTEQHTTDMSILHDEHILVDTSFKSSLKKLLKKRNELSKFTDSSKFLLEVFPDIVRGQIVGLLSSQKDLVLEMQVIILGRAVEFSHLNAWKISFFDQLWVFLKQRIHFEELFSC